LNRGNRELVDPECDRHANITAFSADYIRPNIRVKCPPEVGAGHAGKPLGKHKEDTVVKRIVYLAMAALVAMLILAPTAMGQEMTAERKVETTVEKDLPKSGGMPVGSLVLPAAALLVGGGILGYAVLRRR
jgi:hypothetical protein